MRNQVQKEIKTAKSSFFSDKIEESKNDSKGLWQHLKDLGYKGEKKGKSNIVLNIEGENCHEADKIANHFNSFFTNIASVLVQKLPKPKLEFNVDSEIFKKFYKEKNSNNSLFCLKSVTEEFVLKELNKMNPHKSTGLDDISPKFLKDGAMVLKIPITFLVNFSIQDGVFPDDMKKAKIKPLFKKNSRLDVGNYRPVSILSVVSKILEKAVFTQLDSFLDKNNLIYEHQSGFRKSYSTDSCLIHLHDYIKGNSAKGLYTGMVLLDLQKAFDTVDHKILCDKLKAMGVADTKWFHSYLTDRTQLVNVNGLNSDFANVTCGVPQGSILGPLLFLCYVNDMSISIDKDCKLLLYADDSAILFAHRDPNLVSEKLGKVMESCETWLVDNKLSLHLGKTECMLLGSKRKLKRINSFSVRCGDHNIVSQEKVKYLGLVIDNILSGEEIVNSIIQKVNSRLKFLYRQSKCLNANTRKTLSSALIMCHFDYACSAWYSGLNKKLRNKLQIAQNKIVRFIKQEIPRYSVNSKVLAELNLLKVETRVSQIRLNHVFKIFHRTSPSYMQENFLKVCDNHGYNTRSSLYNFCQPSIKGVESTSFYYNAICDWNGLPDSVKGSKKIEEFKKLVKINMTECNLRKESSSFAYI